MNNILKKVNTFKFVVILSILICLMTAIIILSQTVSFSEDSAKADGILAYAGYSVDNNTVFFNESSSNYIAEQYYDETTGNVQTKIYYKIPFNQSSTMWYEGMISDLSIRMIFAYYSTPDSGPTELQKDPFSVAVTQSQGASNQIYAYVKSFQITGTTWDGQSYSGTASGLTKAGVYKITALTLGCYVGKMCDMHQALKNLEKNPLTGDGSAPYMTETEYVFSSTLDVVVTANLQLDSAQSGLIGINSNLNIPAEKRSYGSASNLRDLIKLHSQTLPVSNNFFTYSSKINSSYNISSGDVKYFKTFSGIGNITEQTTNLEGSYSNTTLIGLENKLNIEWNTGIMGGANGNQLILTKIPSEQAITKAGKYYLRITPIFVYDNKYEPIKVVLSGTGAEYLQEFTVEKKKLNVDLDQNIGVTMQFSKEYDNTDSAASLFRNQNIDSAKWTAIGGNSSDYSTLSQVLSNEMLFSFGNSIFDSADIGVKTLKEFHINLISLSSSDTQFGNPTVIMEIINNYEAIPGRIIGGQFEAYNTATNSNGHKYYIITGFTFRILPPGVNIYFDPMEFSGSFYYGDYLFPTEFVYQRYVGGVYYNSIKATNTQINPLTGLMNVNNFTNWQISVLADSTKMKTDAAKNTVYIIPKVGRKLLPGDTQHTKIFTDMDGQEYYSYSGRLYAAEDYYFYFDIYVYFSSGNNVQVMQNPDYSFSIPESFGSSKATISITTDNILNLKILRREVQLTINQCAVEKTYDGNKKLSAFSASASNIIASDAVMIELGYSAQYSTAGVGINIPINYNYFLKAKIGYEDQDLDNLIASYEINTVNYINNSGITDITKGKINPLSLQIKFLRTNYTRKFNQPLYVVVRVAIAGTAKFSGVILTKDLYYFYGSSVDEPFNSMSGYCYEDELSAFGIYNYAIVEITGFMAGEGFRWDETNTTLRSFMTDMSSDQHVDIPLNTSLLFSWFDSVKNVDINKTTNASLSPSDLYRLEFSDGHEIAPNYIFVPTAPQYAYLYIEKLTPDSDVIIVEGENGDNHMEYNGTSNLSMLFSSGRVKFNNHKEYLEITQPPSELISVIDFTFSCTDSSHDHSIYDLSNPNVINLTLSGIYILRLSLPSTTNYLPVSFDFEVTVHAKEVHVYLTKAVRIYGESEVVYNVNNPKYITDINQHKYMIDSEGNIVEENGNVVYIYTESGNIVEGNFVLYQGLITGDYFGSDLSTDNLADVAVNPGNSNAGIFISAISIGGASKHNYAFNYHPTTLYVIRKELSISAAPVQEKAYTGFEMYPDYTINGGVGNLGMYVIGRIVDGVPIYDETEDETKTSIVDVGVYILKVFAKPRVEDEVNYKTSNERLVIALTIREQEVTLVTQNNYDAKEYDSDYYYLGNFNQYFTGTTAVAQYSWGYVFISNAVKAGGVTVYQAVDALGNLLYLKDQDGNVVKDILGNDVPLWDIRDSAEYTLTVTAIITNTANTYFSDGEGGKIYTLYFTLSLEITKSSALTFTLITSEGTYSTTTSLGYDGTYNLVYNGNEATFNYSLYAGGFDYSSGEVPVTSALNGILYSYNNNIYNFGATNGYDHNAANNIPNKISGIVYNNILNRSKLLNVGTYTIRFYINTEGSVNYNANFMSLEYLYEFVVLPASLRIYIDFDEGYGPYKIYGQDNSEVEEHVIYRYSGWIGTDGENPDILSQIVPPTIDWSDVGNTPVAGDHYFIRPIGGIAPSNYVFDPESPSISFTVKKAESWIIVYGFYDDDTERYTDFNVYSGTRQQPNVIRMAGLNPIDTAIEAIGEDGIKIVLEGGFIGLDKNNILPKDIDRSITKCQDVGKYVFSISVIASTNYNAVTKAYYYYEVTKAELELVFVVQEFDGENYTVTEVRGYSSKVYDGDNSAYPTFTIQYKGFVGEDDTVNSYKNVLQIMHVDNLVYVIVGETTYRTFEKNFISVTDGQGRYIRDSQGNYIMLNVKGNYIKDSAGNYIPVTAIVGNYYKDGEEFKLVNGTHIKNYDNNYLEVRNIVGQYILDENDNYVLLTEIQGKYVFDLTSGKYIDINDTFMLTEDNAYVNINNLVAKYYKDESGSFVKVTEAVAKYIKDFEGNYVNIALAQGSYNKNEAGEYVLVPLGDGAYILDEDGNYLLVDNLAGKYVKDFEGNYFELNDLKAIYVKDKDGRFFVLTDLKVCPFIQNESANYVRATYLTDISDNTIFFFKDSEDNYIDCANAIGTHILSEGEVFIKVRTYMGNLLTFYAPYVRDESGDYRRFDSLTPNYIKGKDGNYYLISEVELTHIRNSVGDYIKVIDNLGKSIKDENGNTYIITENAAIYFCDESGEYFTRNQLTAVYVRIYGGEYIRIVGDYIRLEDFSYVRNDKAVGNYIKDSNGNYLKIKDENGETLTEVYGNYILNASGHFVEVGAGNGTHILDEFGEYIRVNANYNLKYNGIEKLGLINPVYEIFDTDGALTPVDVDIYNIRIKKSDVYGYSKNYDINVKYKQADEEIIYPELEITKRPIDVTYSSNMVTKTYDGYTRIPDGAVTNRNYVFKKTMQGGVEVTNSGLIEGDIVNLRYNSSLSSFIRKDVFDSNGQPTQNYVKLYGYNIDNNNYVLQASGIQVDENGNYILLLANITPASATIRFIDEYGRNITNKLEVVYDAQTHAVNAIVQGVRLDDSSYETISYSINYSCANSNYNSAEPPKNAETYIVTLTINELNYVSTQKVVDLVIQKATVEIVFGGDVIGTYGSIVKGLTAEARGVGGYLQILNVLYYDANGVNIPDISAAAAGTYETVATHQESTNFRLSSKTETFTVKRRDMNLYYGLSSTYNYTGVPIAPDVYFMYNGIKRTPELMFEVKNGNNFVPYNYGENALSASYPKDVGIYRVKAVNSLQNFNIADNYWTEFSIVPINVVVGVADITVLANATYTFNYVFQGAVNGESARAIFTKEPSFRYYRAADNALLAQRPETAGLYRVEPYGAESSNYVLTYKFGMLAINNSKLLAGDNNQTEKVVVSGSFAADVSLITREISNANYSNYLTTFDVFKLSNTEYFGYNVFKIFYLSLSDGSVKSADNGELFIKLYVPELFNKADVAHAKEYSNIKLANDGLYYVAHINAQGEVNVIEAYRDGDYLCFYSNSLEAFCILTTEKISSGKNDDWILYVGIAVGVVLVGIALILVRKRA